MLIRKLAGRIKVWMFVRFKKPARFRVWLELEELKYKLIRAVEDKSDDFPDLVCLYISTALKVQKEYLAGLYWEEVLGLFSFVLLLNLPPGHLPFISIKSEGKKEKDAWDYEGRTWYLYSHILAKKYGWVLEYIESLNVVDALSLVQEVLTDEQLEREFQWGMSEKSVSYNPKTKTTKVHELPRPYWMKKIAKPITKTIMPVSMLPMGNVNYDAVQEDFRPKAIESTGDLVGL